MNTDEFQKAVMEKNTEIVGQLKKINVNLDLIASYLSEYIFYIKQQDRLDMEAIESHGE